MGHVVCGAGKPLRSSFALVYLLSLVACRGGLPTAPSQLTKGIVVYEHANFLGDSALITTSLKDLSAIGDGACKHESSFLDSFPGGQQGASEPRFDWNDCISSIRVASGWRATIYEHPDYKGEFLDVTSDLGNLQLVGGTCSHGGLNDCISSIRIFSAP